MALTLEQRVKRIEAILGPPPFAPLHAITLESVRRSTQFVPANIVGGTAIEVDESTGNVSTINHRIGNFGDLHLNYPESLKTEAISGLWSFNAGLNIGTNQPITFGGDVTLQRAAANVLALGSGDTFRTANFASGYAGWDLAADGSAEFNNVWVRGSIHSAVFVKDLIDARAGTLVIGKSAGVLAVDAYILDWSLYIEDPPTGGFLFEVDDILRLRANTASGILETWVDVNARVDGPAGQQIYAVGYRSGDAAGTYPAGTPVVDYGQSGGGCLLMTAELNYAPYYDVFTHAGAPWTTTTLKVRLGNLAGVTDPDLSPSGYGLYADNVFLKGDLVCGGGEVILDDQGVTLSEGDSVVNQVKWMKDSTLIMKIFAMESSGAHYGQMYITDYGGTSQNSLLFSCTGTSLNLQGVGTGGAAAGGVYITINGAPGAPSLWWDTFYSPMQFRIYDSEVRIYNGATLISTLGYVDTTWFCINYNAPKNTYIRYGLRVDQGLMAGNAGGFQTGCVQYAGNLRPYRNSTQYTGYIYVPITQQIVWNNISRTTGTYDIDTSAYGCAAGCKAVNISLSGQWSSAAGYVYARKKGTGEFQCIIRARVVNKLFDSNAVVNCDASGDIQVVVAGATSNPTTLMIAGYWI